MKKSKEISSYKNFVVASKSKTVWSIVLDFLFTLVLSMLIYMIAVSPIHSSFPSSKQRQTEIASLYDELCLTVGESRLQDYDVSTKSLVDTDTMAASFLTSLAKTSYYINGVDYPKGLGGSAEAVNKEDTFLFNPLSSDGLQSFPNDGISFYYFSFKNMVGNESISSYVYSDVDYKGKESDYLFLKAYRYEATAFDGYFANKESSLPLYQQLEINKAKALVDVLVFNDTGSEARTVYDNLRNSYFTCLNLFTEELESTYTPFVEKYNQHQALTRSHYIETFGGMMIAYTLSFLILELIVPLFLKGKKTIGIKAFSLVYCGSDEMEPSILAYALQRVIRFLIQFLSLAFVLYTFNGIGLLVVDLGGGFTLGYLFLASLLLGITSLVTSLFTTNHQPFPEFLSRIEIRDTQVMEAGTAKEDVVNGK